MAHYKLDHVKKAAKPLIYRENNVEGPNLSVFKAKLRRKLVPNPQPTPTPDMHSEVSPDETARRIAFAIGPKSGTVGEKDFERHHQLHPPHPPHPPSPPQDEYWDPTPVDLSTIDEGSDDGDIIEDDPGFVIVDPPSTTPGIHNLPNHEKSGEWNGDDSTTVDGTYFSITSSLEPSVRTSTTSLSSPTHTAWLSIPTNTGLFSPTPHPTDDNKKQESDYPVNPTATSIPTINGTVWVHKTSSPSIRDKTKDSTDIKLAVGMGILAVVLLIGLGFMCWLWKLWIRKKKESKDLEEKGEKDEKDEETHNPEPSSSGLILEAEAPKMIQTSRLFFPLPSVPSRSSSETPTLPNNLPPLSTIPPALASFHQESSSSHSVRSNSTRTITSQTSHATNDTVARAKREYQDTVSRLTEQRMYCDTEYQVADGFRLAPPNPFEDNARIPDSEMGGINVGVAGLGVVNARGQAVAPPSPSRLSRLHISEHMDVGYVADGFGRQGRTTAARGEIPPPNPFEDPTIDGNDQGAEQYVADGFMGQSHPRGQNVVIDNPFEDKTYEVDEKRLANVGRIPESIQEVDYYIPGDYNPNSSQRMNEPSSQASPVSPVSPVSPTNPPWSHIQPQQIQTADRGTLVAISPSNSRSRRSQHGVHHRYSTSSITHPPSRANSSSNANARPHSVHHSNSLSRSSIYNRRYRDSYDGGSLSGFSYSETLRPDDDISVISAG